MRLPTCKLIEVISNIEGLIVVIRILIVDELHAPWWRENSQRVFCFVKNSEKMFSFAS